MRNNNFAFYLENFKLNVWLLYIIVCRYVFEIIFLIFNKCMYVIVLIFRYKNSITINILLNITNIKYFFLDKKYKYN